MPPSKKIVSDELETFLKSELIDRIRHGRSQAIALAELCLNWRDLARLVKDEAFRDELEAVKEARKAAGNPYYSAEDIAFLKGHICHLIAEEGMTLSQALRHCGVGWVSVGKWRKADPTFNAAINEAQLLLTEQEADRLKDLHTEIPDPKVAKVASDNLRQWLEWRNQKFRPRAPAEESNVQLTDILRAAVNRLIEMTPAPASLPLITDTDAERVTFRDDPKDDTHRP